ncbi:MAG: Ig-like domain-containing protein [Lachnospiraceae bacterium]|nr:Ig-like domain-containing protein [Lachnospiraceae bacterium]
MIRKTLSHRRIPALFVTALLTAVLSFSVTGFCETADADQNGTKETATALKMKTTVKDSLSNQDDVDVFSFSVDKSCYVMVRCTSAFQSASFSLKSEAGKSIVKRYVTGTLAEPEEYKIIQQLTAGTYYLEVSKGAQVGGDYNVYVTDQQPTAMTFSQTTLALDDETGTKAKIRLEMIPKDSVEPTVEWESSDVFVARVDDGEVTANGLGYATVTAVAKEFPSLKAECIVTIRPRQVSDVNVNANATKKKKLAVICTMGYSSAKMPDGYHYYIYDKKSKKYVLKGKSTKNSYTFKGLKEETGYKVRVSAYIKTPAGEVEGELSSPKTLYTAPKTLKATKITGMTKGGMTTLKGHPARTLTLKWNKVKGATSYKIYGQESAGEKFKLMTTSKKPSVQLAAGVGFTYQVYVVPVRTKRGISTDGKKSPKFTVDMRE